MNGADVWKAAVVEFANEHALPAEAVLGAEPFVWGRWRFALHRSEELDPHGLVVVMDLGEIPEATAAQVQLEMLAHNARRASFVLGYLAITPGANRAVYCVRLDERKSGEPAALIAAVVGFLAASLANSLDDLKSMFETLTGLRIDEVEKNDTPL
jgi:hypothetical protein